MQIIWDVITREITVIFRDKLFYVPGKHKSRAEGIAAGERFCEGLKMKEPSLPPDGHEHRPDRIFPSP